MGELLNSKDRYLLISLIGCPNCDLAKEKYREEITAGIMTVVDLVEGSEEYMQWYNDGVYLFPTIIKMSSGEREHTTKVCEVDINDMHEISCEVAEMDIDKMTGEDEEEIDDNNK